MKNKKILILALVFVLILGLAYAAYSFLGDKVGANQIGGSTTPNQEELPLAPDFTVYDEAGNPVKLSDFIGKKPIVLNFWASWCGPCRSEMPDFNAVSQDLKDEVQFLMINVTDGSRETVEIASKFVEENGFAFPVYYDTSFMAAQIYQAYGLPTTYFINLDGRIVARAASAIPKDLLMQGIGMILDSAD